MRKTLVTGAAGFIGSHLTDRLLEQGDRVLGLDNFDPYYDPAIKRRNLQGALKSQDFELVEGDLCDYEGMVKVLNRFRPDVVVHLAARAGVRPSILEPRLYERVNVGGTTNLLEAMRHSGCPRLVYGSTSSVYGRASRPPFAEDSPVDQPLSPYAATKRAGELLAYTYHHLHGLRTTCLRFFTVYGPRQRPEMAIHFFSRLILERRPIPFFGSGDSTRDYTYVDDILDGVLRAIDHEEGYGIYNLGESAVTTLRELVDMLSAALGVPAVLQPMQDQPGDVPATCADIRRARAVLGFQPQIPLAEGLKRFVAWLREERR